MNGKKIGSPVLNDLQLPEKENEIIDKEKGEWEIDKIAAWLTEEQKEAIQKIAIKKGRGKDFLVWPFVKNGMYTVKSGYHKIKGEETGRNDGPSSSRFVDRKVWNLIWKLKVPKGKYIYFDEWLMEMNEKSVENEAKEVMESVAVICWQTWKMRCERVMRKTEVSMSKPIQRIKIAIGVCSMKNEELGNGVRRKAKMEGVDKWAELEAIRLGVEAAVERVSKSYIGKRFKASKDDHKGRGKA
ncbi:hypothetical protein DITRI_Ditri14bG0121000 [Diplodiscus trichospermus]